MQPAGWKQIQKWILHQPFHSNSSHGFSGEYGDETTSDDRWNGFASSCFYFFWFWFAVSWQGETNDRRWKTRLPPTITTRQQPPNGNNDIYAHCLRSLSPKLVLAFRDREASWLKFGKRTVRLSRVSVPHTLANIDTWSVWSVCLWAGDYCATKFMLSHVPSRHFDKRHLRLPGKAANLNPCGQFDSEALNAHGVIIKEWVQKGLGKQVMFPLSRV